MDQKSKMLLILDHQYRGTGISNVPLRLLDLYIEEMELHAEEVFQTQLDDWNGKLACDNDGQFHVVGKDRETGGMVMLTVSVPNKIKEEEE